MLTLYFNSVFASKLSICAIFKNEAPYLQEWIDFHKKQGVKHFYLYNNNSSDDYKAALKSYDCVTIIDWCFKYKPAEIWKDVPWLNIQKGAYTHCLQNHGRESKWMAFIDIDEFLFCPGGESLPDFLKEYEKFGGLMVNWLIFGTSGLEEIPQGKTLLQAFTKCAKRDYRRNGFAKSIVQPSRVVQAMNAHNFVYKSPFFAVDVTKAKLTHPERVDNPTFDKIRINHYWTKSEKFFRERKIPDRLGRRNCQRIETLQNIAKELNHEEDLAILAYQ